MSFLDPEEWEMIRNEVALSLGSDPRACEIADTLCRDVQRFSNGPVLRVLRALVQALAERDAKIAELEVQVPHPGRGECDSCGKVPSVNVPTSLCDECVHAHDRIAELEAQLRARSATATQRLDQIAELETWLPFSTERTRRDARELLGETWAYKPEGSLPGASVSVVRSGVALDVINTLLGSVDTLNARLAELEGRPTHESVAEVRTELIDILSVLAPDDHSKLSTLILVKMFGVYSAEVEQVAENLVRLIGIEPKATVREDLEVLAAWVLEVRKNH